MNLGIFKILLVFLFGGVLISGSIFAEGDGKDGRNRLNKITGAPIRAYMNINNISTVIKNDGVSDIDEEESNSGLVYPKGSGKTAVFTSGLVWGAFAPGDPQVRVGGTTYATGMQAGRILPDGTAEGDLDHVRIYRVRPVVFPGVELPDDFLKPEADDERKSQDDVLSQYILDWQEWPAEFGAPYFDGNDNGVYDSDPSSGDIPGVSGADQTIWFVANDLEPGLTRNLYGADPLGIEMQATFWAYAQTGALGNMFFRKYRIINRSGGDFTNMYLCFWSDVDLGNSTDDFVAVDTTLSLSMSYNANASDGTYSPLPPPVVGFDFFQGPLLDGIAGEDRNKNGIDDADDFGIFDGRVVGPGKINLPMTAAFYFTRGAADVTDPTLATIEGSNEFYNFMQGRIGKTGKFFFDPVKMDSTVFTLTGDVPTRQGWIDGILQGPGDRRQGLSSGPFLMEDGDTQEVVIAEIVAGATPEVDRISAIGLNKFYDQQAQIAYDNFFDLPLPPPAPTVNRVELDRRIVLDWGEDQERVTLIESNDSKGYSFQGYNVYQLPSASAQVSEGIRVATFDIVDGTGKINDFIFDPVTGSVINVPVQFGNDTGIERQISITIDEINQRPLINGIRYYFAVTAYNYNPALDAIPNNLENPITIFTLVPHSKNPGTSATYDYADTIAVSHTRIDPSIPLSDGGVFPLVIDPTQLNGSTYKVTFENVGDTLEVWNLFRDGELILANQTNQLSDAESPIVDGIQFRVQGAPNEFKGFDIIANGNGPVTGAGPSSTYEVTQIGADDLGISASWYRDVLLSINGGALGVNDPMQAGGGFYFIVAGGPSIGSFDAALGRWSRDGARWPLIIPNNFEIRWTGDETNPAGKAWMAFTTGSLVDVPFSLWFLGPNLDDPSDDIRMMPWLFDDNENDIFDFKLDHGASGGDNDPYTDWIYFMMPEENAAPGEAAYDAAVIRSSDPAYGGDIEIEFIARVVIMNWNQHQGDGGENVWPDAGTVFRLRGSLPNSANDEFTLTATPPVTDDALARSQLDEINVFPNPYYGVNSEELNKYNRFVTFSHLPEKAKVRIFNLAGVLVKTIDKDDESQFLRWDLANKDGLPVASGLYIAYIELTDLGETKILKLAIVQEQQILDRF